MAALCPGREAGAGRGGVEVLEALAGRGVARNDAEEGADLKVGAATWVAVRPAGSCLH